MNALPKPQLRKLEDEPLWREAYDVAQYIYEKVARDFPESETWYTASKLRTAALDMLFYTAEALGGSLASNTSMDWSSARKAVSALKTLYPFTARQNFIEMEPEIMVRLDKMIVLIDKEVMKSDKWVRQAIDSELVQWREKYRLWKETEK